MKTYISQDALESFLSLFDAKFYATKKTSAAAYP